MRGISLMLILLVGLAAVPSPPASAETPNGVSVEGKRGRKRARQALYIKKLRNDKRRIYVSHGWCHDRLRFDEGFGRITERWRYHAEGLEFTFDMEGRLVDERRIPVEDRRVR